MATPKKKARRAKSSKKKAKSPRKPAAKKPQKKRSREPEWQDALGKIALAGVGAFVVVREELGDLFERLVAKGEEATDDIKNYTIDPGSFDAPLRHGRKVLKKVRKYGGKLRTKLEEAAERAL